MIHRLVRALAGSTLLLVPLGSMLAGAAIWPAYAEDTTNSPTTSDKRPIIHPNETKFGAYDPHGDFSTQADLATEGLFLPWEDVDLDSLRIADEYALQRGRKLLITIEPWSWNEDWRLTSDQLRRKVLAGEYDGNVQAISDIVKTLKSPVIIRWGQEMEDKSGRFSWSNWPPQDYIKAYKRVIDRFRKDRPTIEVMWSPKGLEGLDKYYPGDDYVDLVGLSVFGLQKYDAIVYGAPRTFAEALQPGYDRVKHFKKPIWVAELGYEGDTKYVAPWIKTVTAKDSKFPDLKEVVYFNDRDVHAWPFGLGRPNWRVAKEMSSN
jgi:endoglucanase